jgi:glycosyltransferase involved in cell wall biosynthesis
MACGTCVLTSRVSSMAEVAGGAATLVDPTDVASIASALASLLGDDRRRAAMVADGMARARQFSWTRTAELTEAVYRQAGRRA